MKRKKGWQRILFSILVGGLITACGPSTTPVTVGGGTAMPAANGGQVQAQMLSANLSCLRQAVEVRPADQGLVLFCTTPKDNIPFVVLGTAVGLAASDGVSPVMKVVALVYVASKLVEAMDPAQIAAPDAYLVPWDLLGVQAVYGTQVLAMAKKPQYRQNLAGALGAMELVVTCSKEQFQITINFFSSGSRLQYGSTVPVRNDAGKCPESITDKLVKELLEQALAGLSSAFDGMKVVLRQALSLLQ